MEHDLIVSERGRIALRPWSEDDADALFALASEPAVAEAAPFPVHGDRTESLRVIREVFCAPESYAIVSRADGGLLGCINVFPGAKGEDVYRTTTVKIGYWLGKPFWGRGFMTEAVTALCSRCFHSGRFNCERIIGLTSPGNLGSRRVMEKSGFRLVEANDNVCRYVLEGRECKFSAKLLRLNNGQGSARSR